MVNVSAKGESAFGGKKQFEKSYEDIIPLDNLFAAWQEILNWYGLMVDKK
jgi:hypothetical protein